MIGSEELQDASPDGGITIVTHRAVPGGAPDDRLLADALHRRGMFARFAPWNDDAIDWRTTPVTIVRSAWDYYRDPAGWTAWIDAASSVTTIVNAPAVLRWNSDKRYLRDLEQRDVACVPTDIVEPGDPVPLAARAARRGWAEVIVKPAIGASAFGARRFAGAAVAGDGEAHLRMLLDRGHALVQPYLPAVDSARERSLVYIAGAFVHAFTKPAFSTDAAGATSIVAHRPSAEELALATAALAAADEAVHVAETRGRTPPLYARVDLVPAEAGPLLMELELVEPDLGLRLDPSAVECLADALAHVVA